MVVNKVAAHQHLASAISGQQSLFDYLGNHLADAAAGAAAERALAASERAEAIATWECRAFIVAKRLAFIEAWHWRQPCREELLAPEPLPPWEPPEPSLIRNSIQSQIDARGHMLFRVNGRMSCRRCHKKRNANEYKYWINNTCIPKWTVKRAPPQGEQGHDRARRRLDEGGQRDHDVHEPCLRRLGHGDPTAAGTGSTAMDVCDHGDGRPPRATADLQMIGHQGQQQPDGHHGGEHPTTTEGMVLDSPSRHDEDQAAPVVTVDGAARADPHHVVNAEDWIEADIEMIDTPAAHESFEEDPFGFYGLGFDEAGDGGARGSSDTLTTHEASGQHGVPPSPSRDSAANDASAVQPMDIEPQAPPAVEGPEPAAHADAPARDAAEPRPPGEGGELTRSGRRKAVLERLAEAKRRRHCEASAARDAWANIAAAVNAQDLASAVFADVAPPFATHDTHALLACGGYYGCVRCGKVVGWQRHDQLGVPCRGSCPRGSVRAIRRLAQGLHPFERGKEDSTCAWPSGETNPKPQRLRLARG